jgi:hypothetical protein
MPGVTTYSLRCVSARALEQAGSVQADNAASSETAKTRTRTIRGDMGHLDGFANVGFVTSVLPGGRKRNERHCAMG